MKTIFLIIIGLFFVSFAVVIMSINDPDIFVFCEAGFYADDRGKCMPDKQFLDFGKIEPSKLIISVDDPINSLGLAPLTTTLVFTSPQPITEISERSFEPTNYADRQPDEMGTSWDILPDSLLASMIIVDENNIDVIDRTKSMSDGRAYLQITQATCSDKMIGSFVSFTIPKNFTM